MRRRRKTVNPRRTASDKSGDGTGDVRQLHPQPCAPRDRTLPGAGVGAATVNEIRLQAPALSRTATHCN